MADSGRRFVGTCKTSRGYHEIRLSGSVGWQAPATEWNQGSWLRDYLVAYTRHWVRGETVSPEAAATW